MKGAEIGRRRAYTENKTRALREQLAEAEELLGDDGCVYATGSFGRLEAGENSDLDLFIVGLNQQRRNPETKKREATGESRVSNLNAICITADLIRSVNDLGLPTFDGDGKYLRHYSVHDLLNTLGKPEDDASNTLTARLLLTLESRCLLGHSSYEKILEQVIEKYWRDYEGHRDEFMPAFFANDILRLWRTFCINYEANTRDYPDDEKIKRKIKNYKLKHSRMLTCFSAILHMLDEHQRKHTVAPHDALAMIKLTPLERLETVKQNARSDDVTGAIDEVFTHYEAFLTTTNVDKAALQARFRDPDQAKVLGNQAYEFGDAMARLLKHVGDGSRFYRLLIV